MTRYAEIYGSTVVKTYNDLPKVWKNISGFHALSDLELSDLMWSGNSGYRFYQYEEDPKPSSQDGFYYVNGPYFQINDIQKKVVGTWTSSPIATNAAWDKIRAVRNQLLYACDWTQLPDAPLTAEKKAEWTTYRQALRDITTQEDPFNISWPTEPVA